MREVGSADQSHNVDTANAVRIDGKSKRAQPVKMESHPAWVKRLLMASIWTRSGQETYIGKKKSVFETKGHLSRKDQKIGSAISLKI